jgi:hypothetical protein
MIRTWARRLFARMPRTSREAPTGRRPPSLTVTLTAGNGTLSVTDIPPNLTVSGNGTGTVNLSGSVADLNAALAILAYRGNPTFRGTDTLNVTASDGSRSTSGSVTLNVQSRSRATTDLQTQPGGVDTAGLDPGIERALGSQLQAAIAYFTAGATADAVRQLGAFIDHVSAQRGKKIAAALADAWIADVQGIINAVG